jgi:D-alanyl-D-alanine carboxypeptidase
MKKIIIVFVMLIFAMGACKKNVVEKTASCNADYSDLITPNHPKAAEYQAILDSYIEKGLPGVSLLVQDSDGIWMGASGKADLENDVNMETCTISKVASVTKFFMGTLSMMLVEEGVFSLDDKISKYLPKEIIDHVENADKATIRNLLNHTSGIYDIVDDNIFYLAVLNNPSREWTGEELVKFIYDRPANFEMGTSASYSNSNFMMLSLVMEHATGKKHGQLLHEKIIDPLHLDNTVYHTYDRLPEHVAQGYYDLYHTENSIQNLTDLFTGNGNGYNGIYSCTADLYKFIKAVFVDKIMISQASIDEMTQNIVPDPSQEERWFGLGCYRDFQTREDSTQYAYGHRGKDLAYSADLFYFPNQNVTFTYIMNYGANGDSYLRPTLLEFRNDVVDEMMK